MRIHEEYVFLDEVIANALLAAARSGKDHVTHSQVLSYVEMLDKVAREQRMNIVFILDSNVQTFVEINLDSAVRVFVDPYTGQKSYYLFGNQPTSFLERRYHKNLNPKRQNLYKNPITLTGLEIEIDKTVDAPKQKVLVSTNK